MNKIIILFAFKYILTKNFESFFKSIFQRYVKLMFYNYANFKINLF